MTESVRATARRLAREHLLDEPGRAGLQALVGAVEQSWYGAAAPSDPALPALLETVRASFTRCAPPDGGPACCRARCCRAAAEATAPRT